MLQNESITIAPVELLMQPKPHHKSHVFTIYSTTTFYSNYIKSLNDNFTNDHFHKIDTHSKQNGCWN